jgi:hypothetical protein
MLGQLVEDYIRAVASVYRNVGVDEIGHGRPSIPSAHGNVYRLPFFDARRLGHAAQRGDNIAQVVARRIYGDDVAEARNLQRDVYIVVRQFHRNANSLAVAGFKNPGSRH